MKVFKFFVNKKEKFFRNIIANMVIVAVIASVFLVAFNSDVKAVFSLNSDEAIYRGNSQNNNVSLMINVYWGTEYLDAMLETLKENEVKCTFFVGGTWVAQNPEMLKKIYNDGHEIANHGYYHKDHKFISAERNQEEIYVNHELVKTLIGYEMNLFAPPSGSYSSATLNIASSLGYKTIMWSKDTIDWRDKNVDYIYKRATQNLKNGDLILMHPTQCTLEALPNIIKSIKEQKFNLTTVTENLK